jgi:GT2 family glycosyltransferase
MAIRLDDPGRSFIGSFDRIEQDRFSGWVFSPDDPDRRFVVEILIDGEPVFLLRAEQFVPALYEQGRGDGCYGFTCIVPRRDLKGRRSIEARLANSGERVGMGVDLVRDAAKGTEERSGEVRWAGGLRLTGWTRMRAGAERAPKVRIFHRDAPVIEASPLRWSSLAQAAPEDSLVPFDVTLPGAFEDGRLRLLTVLDETDRPLEGSPVAILAFPRTSSRHLVEGGDLDLAPADVLDRLLPTSVPFSETRRWRERFEPFPSSGSGREAIRVVLIGPESEFEAAAERLEAQSFERWSLAAVVAEDGWTFSWADLSEAVTIDGGHEPILCFLRTDMTLAPETLDVLAAALDESGEAVLAYADFVVRDGGEALPVCHSAFDYERLLEQGAICHLAVIRRDVLLLPEEEGSGSIYRIVSALADETGPAISQRVLHVPALLGDGGRVGGEASARALAAATAAHLSRRGVPADVSSRDGNLFPAVHVMRDAPPYGVSVLIPSRDRPEYLAKALDGLRRTAWKGDIEILVVDTDSTLARTHAFLDELRKSPVRVISSPNLFNRARAANRAAAQARGDVLCFLNDDVEITDASWLAELLSRLCDPTVGAVGPLLAYPDGMVRSAGLALGPGFSAIDAATDHLADDPGYADLLRVAREPGALAGACLVTRRVDFETFGGFDDTRFPFHFADVDYCLRLRKAGKRIVFTPHARLIYPASGDRPGEGAGPGRARMDRDLAMLRSRWGEVLAADPAYSPLLNRDAYPYSGLAWPPGDRRCRLGWAVEKARPEIIAPDVPLGADSMPEGGRDKAVDAPSEALRRRLRALSAPPRG